MAAAGGSCAPRVVMSTMTAGGPAAASGAKAVMPQSKAITTATPSSRNRSNAGAFGP
jgi:hypothetical protein